MASPHKGFVVRSDGSVEARRVGLRASPGGDLYHFLRTTSWSKLLLSIVLVYLASNALFALAYLAGGDCIEGIEPGSFWGAFFFSVETMSTIGYGDMVPAATYAHGLVVVEAIFGLLLTATSTGVIFSKFATPSPRVLFSKVCVVGSNRGEPTLMFRMANKRASHMIVEAQVRVTVARDVQEADGSSHRHMFDLPLTRATSPLFALTWTAFHTIDDESPFHGATQESLSAENFAMVITMTGIDDTLQQSTHARYCYFPEDIVFDARLADIIRYEDDGTPYIDYRRFHDVERLDSSRDDG